MCVAPLTLSDGQKVACHECWQCREHRIDDWVGRNIAESRTAKWARAITLTYGRNRWGDADHERAVVLTYSDVQKWIKRLRFHGYPVRYFITGEFGSNKGRAHWHVMLYGSGKMPEHKLDDSFHVGAHWEHGFSFWTKPEPHAVRYNCKYLQKDIGEAERQGHLAMSKKPPLGAAYFEQLAQRYVDQGLAPRELFYSFPDVLDSEGKPKQFMLAGRSAELFLDHYVTKWERDRPGRPFPVSELVTNWVEWGTYRVPELGAAYGEFVERRRTGGADKPVARRPKVYTDDRLDMADWVMEVAMEQVRNGKEQQQQNEERERSITPDGAWRGEDQRRDYVRGRRLYEGR